jgi:hypothetical protein
MELMFCFVACGSQNVTLEWNASTDPATVGYILHLGTNSHTYTSKINVAMNTVVTLSGLADGRTYYFVVGGYNSAGVEGPPSNEASFVAPLSASSPAASARNMTVSPASGTPGTQVFLYGSSLSGATSVNFNGTPATFSVISNSFLAAVVPPGATTGPLTVITPAGLIIGRFTIATTPAPANDNFASPRQLLGINTFAFGDTTAATKEPGEPNHAGNSGGASVWYRWTAPITGLYSLDAGGTQFTPLLAVYAGNSMSQLSVVASNAPTYATSLVFQATRGVTYEIAVDGFGGASGKMQLRLCRQATNALVFFDNFDGGGIVGKTLLSGQGGWLSSLPALSGVAVNYFPGYGQQGYLGLSSLLLGNNTALLYHPLNFAVDTNNQPLIQFSVMFDIYEPLLAQPDSFGWVFRNTAGQQLFSVMFNNATRQITYSLDDGAGQRSSGSTFSANVVSQLSITADFSRNEWGATLNGTPIIAGQPMTTIGASLTLGDIAAAASYPRLQSALDGMLFDNYTVTANPEPAPRVVVGPQSQSLTAGNDLVLDVIATGTPPLSSQWNFHGGALAGQTNAGLWLTNATTAESGNYSVVVRNANGAVYVTCAATVSTPLAQVGLPVPVATGSRMINFSVASGHSYRVLASTNMTSWSQVGSFYASSTNASYVDAAAGLYSQRFYRLVSP